MNIAIDCEFCFVSQMMLCEFLFETNEMFTPKGLHLVYKEWIAIEKCFYKAGGWRAELGLF